MFSSFPPRPLLPPGTVGLAPVSNSKRHDQQRTRASAPLEGVRVKAFAKKRSWGEKPAVTVWPRAVATCSSLTSSETTCIPYRRTLLKCQKIKKSKNKISVSITPSQPLGHEGPSPSGFSLRLAWRRDPFSELCDAGTVPTRSSSSCAEGTAPVRCWKRRANSQRGTRSETHARPGSSAGA